MDTQLKPERYFPKPGRKLTGRKAETHTSRQPVLPANNGQSMASDTSPMSAETQTQIANRIFQERVKKIADVEVIIRRGNYEWEPNYIILMPEMRHVAFDKVLRLRRNLYRKYPEAILNLNFRGRRELGERSIEDILIS